MNIFKTFVILFLIIIGVATILTFALPVKKTIKKSITINAGAPAVYDYLTRLSNFNKWSVWSNSDSSIVNSITGTDGTTGAINNWEGDPEISGTGTIKITSLSINKEVNHDITFIKPRHLEADARYELVETNGQTNLTWTFSVATPRPSNIFNLISSMEKEMGKDFEISLLNLKAAIEKTDTKNAVSNLEVNPITFPTTTYAAYRETVARNNIHDFFNQHIPSIRNEAIRLNANPGIASALYYEWNNTGDQADMAIGIPVADQQDLGSDSISMITITGSKAVYVDYSGSLDQSKQAYFALEKYLIANGLKQKQPVIEQYAADPVQTNETTSSKRRIIFLVE